MPYLRTRCGREEGLQKDKEGADKEDVYRGPAECVTRVCGGSGLALNGDGDAEHYGSHQGDAEQK